MEALAGTSGPVDLHVEPRQVEALAGTSGPVDLHVEPRQVEAKVGRQSLLKSEATQRDGIVLATFKL